MDLENVCLGNSGASFLYKIGQVLHNKSLVRDLKIGLFLGRAAELFVFIRLSHKRKG